MKLFDNYFYGRPDCGDYTPDDQPKTRAQLFFQVLRVRWGGLVGLNLLYLFFWLPALIWTALCWGYFTQVNAEAQLYNTIFTYLLLLCPLCAITGPANMGLCYVLRNWARDEHAYAWTDFWQGLRDNWKQGLLLGFLKGFVPLALYVWAYIVLVSANLLSYVPAVLALICAIIYALAEMLMPMQIVTYRQSFAAKMKNAVIITLAQLPRAVGIKLLTYAVPIAGCALAKLCGKSWPLSLVAGLYCVILISFNKLIVASYANAMCEKYINSKIDGAQTDIGIYKDE